MNLQPPSALLITVNYRGADETIKLLASLRNLDGFPQVDVVVVDNGSGDDSWSKISAAISSDRNVRVLASPENRGYFGAARLAWDQYPARESALPDWVIVCNHDVAIADRHFFIKLCSQDSSAVGVIAPRITVPSNAREQNPYMVVRPGWWRRFTMLLYSSCYPLGWAWDWLSRQKRILRSNIPSVGSRPRLKDKQTIYAAHGSFLIFSRRFFEAGGYLDDQLFLFGEEIAVGETCRRLGLAIVYEPKLHVLHNEHCSIGVGMSRRAYNYHRQSVRYLFSKYLVSRPRSGDATG